MQVRELKELLEKVPDNSEVFVQTIGMQEPKPLLTFLHCFYRVTLTDVNVVRQPKTIRAFDGAEYEVPWP